MKSCYRCSMCRQLITIKPASLKAKKRKGGPLICQSCCQLGKHDGEKNHFYGKKHTDASKKQMSESQQNLTFRTTSEYRDKMSQVCTGKGNPMHGKTVYGVWVEKYGVDEANRKMNDLKKKRRQQMTGKGNNMFGKPTPQGSGNGWSGWYGDHFFRSLKELSYLVKVIEPQELSWETAESAKLSIPYVDSAGVDRTYRPDFLVQGTRLIEIKPKRLHQSVAVLEKAKAGNAFAVSRGWTYEVLDPPSLTSTEIKSLHDSGKIRFLPRYEEKYQAKYA